MFSSCCAREEKRALCYTDASVVLQLCCRGQVACCSRKDGLGRKRASVVNVGA
jgi:hypothetical protein